MDELKYIYELTYQYGFTDPDAVEFYGCFRTRQGAEKKAKEIHNKFLYLHEDHFHIERKMFFNE